MRQNILFIKRLVERSPKYRESVFERTEFGSSLRTLRLKRNMTLNKLSELTGIQIATLSRMETKKMVGTLKSYVDIAKVFNLKLSELFKQLEDRI